MPPGQALAPLALAAIALVASVAAQTRPANKSANTANIAFLDGGSVISADQFYFGMLMAGNEINSNTSILQDVKLLFPRIRVQSFTSRPAAVYDSVAALCDTGIYRAFMCRVNSVTARAIALICPKVPTFSSTAATTALSDKSLYPKFYRSQIPVTQGILTMIAMFRYFGWRKTGIAYGASGLFPESGDASKQLFPIYGIQVLTSIKVPDYDSTISQLYYPQIKSQYNFLAQTKLRILCAFFDTSAVIDFAMAANRSGLIGRDYVWFSLNTPSYDSNAQLRWDTPLDPSLFRSMLIPSFESFPNPSDPYYIAFFPRFQAFATWTIANQANLYRDINFAQTDTRQQDYPPNFFYADPPTDSIPSTGTIAAYDSVRALAYTLERVIVEANTTGAALANGSLTSSITLAKLIDDYSHKPMLVNFAAFTPQGDPVPNPFVMSIMRGEGLRDTFDTAANVTIDSITGVGNVSLDESKFFWSGNRSFNDVPIDSAPEKEDFVKITDGVVIVLVYMAILVVLLCVSAAAFVFFMEKSQFIRPFSPRLLSCIALGLAVIQFNTFVLIGKEKPIGCALRPWPTSLGITMVLASIIAKNLRMIGVFSFSASRLSLILDKIKKEHIIAIHVAMIVLVVVLLAIGSALSPMISEAVYVDLLDAYRFMCVAGNAMGHVVKSVVAYIVLQVLAVWLLCFANRDLPDAYNDARESASSAAVILLLGAICFLAGSTQSTATSEFAMESACTAVTGITVLILMLGKPVTNCVVEELLSGHRVNKSARVRTKQRSKSGTRSASHRSHASRDSAVERPTPTFETEEISLEVQTDLASFKSLMVFTGSFYRNGAQPYCISFHHP
ncbi:hypothetical protein HK105_205257 [Polyrhizophydium stewartii]|uniref:G-protein coupled receptors family 3 profile domain-containing protein n=1 Tax=Polyrhizophydium stewartii TaxID=2732419 RepID=A0ABR4N6P2_9FUNG